MLNVCDSVMTQLSRIVDLYFSYDSIVIVTEVYYRREESRNYFSHEHVTIIKFCNRGLLQREESR